MTFVTEFIQKLNENSREKDNGLIQMLDMLTSSLQKTPGSTRNNKSMRNIDSTNN
jgi:hypothetical protein